MDVKLGELGTWLGGRDFTPNGIIQAIRRGDCRHTSDQGPEGKRSKYRSSSNLRTVSNVSVVSCQIM